MNLYVFNQNTLEPIGFIDVITGLTWEEKFADAGSFELWAPLNDQNTSLLQEDNLLWKGGTSAGLIEFKELSVDDEGTQTIHVQGRLCECYLDFRTIYPALIKSGKPTKIMRDLVTNYLINPSDENRKIPNIQLESSPIDYGSSISYQRTGSTVLIGCSDLGQAYAIGFRLKFVPKDKVFIFQTYQGTNRTLDQSSNTPVLFSSDLDDILESSYSHNKLNYRNFAYVAGEDSGKNRKVKTIGNSSGLNRRELFVDARDLQTENDDGTTISDAEYESMLIERGKENLEDYKDIESFSATIRTFGVTGYTFGTDFFLGDSVTVYDSRLKIKTNAIVTSAVMTYDESGEQLDLTFGYSQPTIAAKLRRGI